MQIYIFDPNTKSLIATCTSCLNSSAYVLLDGQMAKLARFLDFSSVSNIILIFRILFISGKGKETELAQLSSPKLDLAMRNPSNLNQPLLTPSAAKLITIFQHCMHILCIAPNVSLYECFCMCIFISCTRMFLQRKVRRGQHRGGKSGRGSKGQGAHKTLPRIGFEGGNTPFYLIVPKEPYYAGHQ